MSSVLPTIWTQAFRTSAQAKRNRSLNTEESRAITRQQMSDIAAAAGLRRVHFLQWRDLDDVEAGGSEVHSATVARLWADAGLDVTMRSSYAQGHPPREERDGYQVVRRAGRYLVFPRAAFSEATGRHGPRDGLVEIWNGVPFLSPLWCRGPRVVLLHHVHADMWRLALPENPKLAEAGVLFESKIAPKFYRRTPIITLSWSSRAELVDDLGFSPDQVTVAPPGIDPRFVPSSSKSTTPLLVAVGRLMPSKHFDRLIDAVATLKERTPDLELVIVGSGLERRNLERQIENLNAESWIRLAGHVDDDELLELYQQAWAVVSASSREGWGMTLTEAAACGTPSIATDIPGHQDAVADGESGLLARSTPELVTHLDSIISDADVRERLSKGALVHARKFTWEATAKKILEVLASTSKSTATKRPGGGPVSPATE